jgi:hypothetical protein
VRQRPLGHLSLQSKVCDKKLARSPLAVAKATVAAATADGNIICVG